ncbi:phage tail protein [Loktanella sp. Alg231-35]|uniref:phage tail protein n=1 Tax=Loktanella sp. Alg231-35 TaxID=1922220 RepID=UPI00131ED3AB|nr:phage tail protein [Loktanella sp. Alg231-35]
MRLGATSALAIGWFAAALSLASDALADGHNCSLKNATGTTTSDENDQCLLAKIEALSNANETLQQQIANLPSELSTAVETTSSNTDFVNEGEVNSLISSAVSDLRHDLPLGTIVAWQGTGTMPDGWAICNGTNGTPDLRGRFLRGVGGLAEVGQQGGLAQHTISPPNHSHNIARGSRTDALRAENGGGVITHTTVVDYLFNTYTDSALRRTQTIDIDNLPPYETVIYIMKIRSS